MYHSHNLVTWLFYTEIKKYEEVIAAVHTHIYTSTHTHTPLHTDIHTHAHTHIHTYIHTHTRDAAIVVT